jgi:hypothetical protein
LATTTWLGLGNGSGALGTTFYPIEFTNTGNRFHFRPPDRPAGERQRQEAGHCAQARRDLGTSFWESPRPAISLAARCAPARSAQNLAPGQQAAHTIPNFTFTAPDHRYR